MQLNETDALPYYCIIINLLLVVASLSSDLARSSHRLSNIYQVTKLTNYLYLSITVALRMIILPTLILSRTLSLS